MCPESSVLNKARPQNNIFHKSVTENFPEPNGSGEWEIANLSLLSGFSVLKGAAIIKMVVFSHPDTKYTMSVPTPLCNYLSPSRCPTIHFNSNINCPEFIPDSTD